MEQKRYSLKQNAAVALGFLLCVSLLFQVSRAVAANFDIQPVRIFFDSATRVEKLTIRNQDSATFPLQVKAFKWSQNEKGEDVYVETNDIVTFPRILSIRQGEEKLIRIGTNLEQGEEERTYRVYVEEIPSPEVAKEGATVRLRMKMGVPVFVNPVKPNHKAEIESISMKDGRLDVKVRNNGNLHLIVTGISIKGENGEGAESFSRDLGGWYILAGSSRTYEASIPLDVCADTKWLNVEVKTNRGFSLKDKILVETTKCAHGHASYLFGLAEGKQTGRIGKPLSPGRQLSTGK